MATSIAYTEAEYIDINTICLKTAFSTSLQECGEKETEQNWKDRERFVRQLRGFVLGGLPIHYLSPDIVNLISSCALSLRTQLCIQSCWLIKDLSRWFGLEFQTISTALLVALLKLCRSTKRLAIISASESIEAMLISTRDPQWMHLFIEALLDRNKDYRLLVAKFILSLVKAQESPNADFFDQLNVALKCLSNDAHIPVKQIARDLLITYENKFPNEWQSFLASSDPISLKALNPCRQPMSTVSKSLPIAAFRQSMRIPGDDTDSQPNVIIYECERINIPPTLEVAYAGSEVENQCVMNS